MANTKEKSQKGLSSEHTTYVDAVHADHGKRSFTLYEWNMMPEGKYGWKKAAEAPAGVSKKQKTSLQKEVDAAQAKVDKATKSADATREAYIKVTTQEDPEKVKAQEPQAKMKVDDAARALEAANEELVKAQTAFNEAE